MAPPRTPRRTRSQRAVTVIHFAKRREVTAKRAPITRTMPQIEVEDLEDDEPTEVTQGEAERPDLEAEEPPKTLIIDRPKRAPEGRREPEERREAAPRETEARREPEPPREYLVDIPNFADAPYRVDRVARLLKGQRPGHPFPPLADDDVTELACFGRTLFEAGRFEDAQQVLEGLVASGVSDGFPYTMLGTVYLAQRDLNRALALFEAALTLSPRDLAAHVYRAEIRVRQGRGDLASADLRFALEHGDPDDPFTARAEQLRRLVRRARSVQPR